MVVRKLTIVLLMAILLRAATAAELLQEQFFIPYAHGDNNVTRVQVIAVRVVYRPDDMNGQFLVVFLGHVRREGEPAMKTVLSLKDAAGKALAAKAVAPVTSPKLPVLVAVSELAPGKYTLAAALQDKDGKTIETAATTFALQPNQGTHLPFPKASVAITPHPQYFVPDVGWPISTQGKWWSTWAMPVNRRLLRMRTAR